MKYKIKKNLKAHQGAVYSLCPADEEFRFFSAGADRNVVLWNLKQMKAEGVVAKSPTTVISLSYLKASNLLFIGQVEGGVHVIDLNENKEIHYLKPHQGYIFKIIQLEDKKEMLLCSGDGSFSVWSTESFEMLYQTKCCQEKIRTAVDCQSLNFVAIGLGNGKVQLYNRNDWSLQDEIVDLPSSIMALGFNDSSKELIIGEKDAHLSIYDFKSAKISERMPAHYWAIYDVAVEPSGKRFITASRDKTIKVWSAETTKVLKRFEGFKDLAHTHSVNTLLWIEDEKLLISSGDDGNVKIWDL